MKNKHRDRKLNYFLEDEKELIEKSNEAWRKLSEWWSNDIEDGDTFHRYLIFPHMLALINCQPGQKILDIACGNGTLSRRLFTLGAEVLGIDISEIFIKQAIQKSDSSIRYQMLDVTSENELTKLAEVETFDNVVCSMALHDLPTIKPLLYSLSRLMNPQGSFIFSIPHPCFNMGEVTLDFFSKMPLISRSHYIKPQCLEMKSKPNQPLNQYCFHRSMTDLFQQLFSAGMVLDALKEPTMSEVREDLRHVDLDWKLLPEIPPALICRWIFRS